MNIHHLPSDLREVSGEMQHNGALQHSSLMESHGVAAAARAPGRLYQCKCWDGPLAATATQSPCPCRDLA